MHAMVTPNLFRKFRERRGLTQGGYAAKLGVDQSTVSRWERNLQLPDEQQWRSLAALEGIAVDALKDSAAKGRDDMADDYVPILNRPVQAGDMTGYLVSSDGFGGHGHLAEGAPPAFGAQPPEIEQKIILLRIEAALLEAGLSVNDSANLSQKLAHIVFPQKGPKS